MILALSAVQMRALADLRAGLPETRLVLIGAAALGCHVPLPRTTGDIDIAVVLAPTELERVLEPLGWRRDPRALQRWHGPGAVVADLLPATADLVAAGEIRFDGDDVTMSLVGFDLALRHTVAVPLDEEGTSIEVPVLAALVVLKIVAWLDRPAARAKDLGDLAHVLDAALADDDERRWDRDDPIFLAGLDHEDQSAFFVGHEVTRIAASAHRQAVSTFLERMSAPDGAEFAAMLRAARYGGASPEERLERRLAAFRRGFEAVR